jgi:aspartyl/asparaginyl beta-hydroxylase (cupin superfamily)
MQIQDFELRGWKEDMIVSCNVHLESDTENETVELVRVYPSIIFCYFGLKS